MLEHILSALPFVIVAAVVVVLILVGEGLVQEESERAGKRIDWNVKERSQHAKEPHDVRKFHSMRARSVIRMDDRFYNFVNSRLTHQRAGTMT